MKMWLLVPKKSNLYAPGFKGTLEQAVKKAVHLAKQNKSTYYVYEPGDRYRGGPMELRATAKWSKG